MGKERILVIDDNTTTRFILSKALTAEGYDVAIASNGDEGLKLFYENPAKLVITDIMMPEKNGVEVIVKLKEDFPDIRIIAISGGTPEKGNDLLRMTKILGAKSTLKKPLEKETLLKAVKDALQDS